MQVLIVDDDIATVDVIAQTVHWDALGIQRYYTAYNIQRAKEILCEEEIDIVISDIEMPQGDGIDLLRWFREEQMEGEFLLLTCHESFGYAAAALKLGAAEYLLKPFDVDVMDMALKKLVQKIKEERRSKESAQLGEWARNNQAQVQLSFLRMALYGRLENEIEDEIYKRKLDLSPVKKYRLVESRITDTEHGRQRVSTGLFCFVLENIQSEVLCGDPENKRVLSIEERNQYTALCVCEDGNIRELENKCKEMSYRIREYLGATVSCCLSRACTIVELHEVMEACTKLLDSRVSYYGSVFLQENVSTEEYEKTSILSEEELFYYISAKDKMKVMAYLKERLNSRMYDRSLNTNMLYHMSQGILRTVYTYLARKDIRTEEFFVDEEAVLLTQKASQSAMDMLRFAGYLLDQTYQYEDNNLSGENNIDRINRFIHEHYMENIGRTEIAAYLHLAPEYVSKLYKKETGNSLTDEITRYRIEKAKLFLRKEDMSIGEVSENCGFENFTYFSTIFKKYTGMTPNQYRKNLKNNS